LWNLDESRKKFVWERWLSDYWKNRILGKPIPLDSQEFTEMVQWAPHLRPVFPEVVERIYEIHLPLCEMHGIWHRLIENKIPKDFPKETLKFLNYILSNSQNISFWKLDELISELYQYKEICPDFKEDLKKVLDKLAEKGFPVSEYLVKLNSDGYSPFDF